MVNQIPSFLTVVSTDPRKTSENQLNYSYTTVQEQTEESFHNGVKWVTIKKAGRTTAFNLYELSYGKPNPIYPVRVGDNLMGKIVTREVSPYQATIDGVTKTFNTFSCVVLGDSRNVTEFEKLIQSTFKSAGHPLTEVTAPVEMIAENPLKG